MPGNSIGHIFRLTSFGESHGLAVGGIIDGFPAGFSIDFDNIQKELDLRRPGQSEITTSRGENDKVEFLSGIFEGKSTGAPIAFLVYNKDAEPAAYDGLKDIFRPSHADYTYYKKYGIRDHRGGGRSSARETIARVVAGAFAAQYLKKMGIEIHSYVSGVGEIELKKRYAELDLTKIFTNSIRCPDLVTAKKMIARVNEVMKEGDTIGGIISCVARNIPAGLGEPVFSKLHAEIGKAVLSIPAVKGIEFGSGFSCAAMKGSEHNDVFYTDKGRISTRTNHSGGIQGGISNGEDIYFRVAFKPVSGISMQQEGLDIKGNTGVLKIQGRHDPCVLPRAVPVVSAMVSMVLLDFFLQNKLSKY